MPPALPPSAPVAFTREAGPAQGPSPPANVPLQRFTPGTWHHIVAEYHNDVASHSVFHDALTVDGVRTPVNIRHDAFFSGAANDQFTNAFQLDSNSVPLPYSVFLDRMKVTYK